MRKTLFIALMLLAGPAIADELSPELIRQAINDTKGEGCYTLGKSFWDGSSWGCYTTPYSRIVQAAKKARMTYKSFTEADVTPELVAPGELHVYAFARPMPDRAQVSDVEAVVISSRGAIVHPLRTEETSVEYRNLMGASLEGKSVTAVFPLEVLKTAGEVRAVYLGGYNGRYEMKARLNPAKAR